MTTDDFLSLFFFCLFFLLFEFHSPDVVCTRYIVARGLSFVIQCLPLRIYVIYLANEAYSAIILLYSFFRKNLIRANEILLLVLRRINSQRNLYRCVFWYTNQMFDVNCRTCIKSYYDTTRGVAYMSKTIIKSEGSFSARSRDEFCPKF